MRKTRIAIVGVGLAATPHALALNDSRDEVEVVGAMDRSRERIEPFGNQIQSSNAHVDFSSGQSLG